MIASAPASAPALTPPEVARQLGIDARKVVGWINSGELRAVNLASVTSGRPRWRILAADLEAFLLRRSAQVATKPIRRRRQTARPAGWVNYF